jgi:superfamily II DNA or RNA helicase
MDLSDNVQKFKIGSEVQLISDSTRIGVVVDVECFHGGLWYYCVNFGGDRKVVPETDLLPHVLRQKPVDKLHIGKLGNCDEFKRNILYQKLSKLNILTNNVYAFNVSRTIFYPYQFKPLLKFIESANHRILIADEVGLGKTIEAGLIYMELKARQSLNRVLIICPSVLREKWQIEMESRFGEEFKLINGSDLVRIMDKYRELQVNTPIRGIISLESIRQAQVLKKIEDISPDFDLIIIDEAHHMRNPETKQNKIGKALSEGASAMIMLSATPIQLGSGDLFQLLNILDDESFPNLAISEELFKKNEPVVKAQSCISRIPVDINEAIGFIKKSERYLKDSNKPYLHSLCLDILDRMNALRENKKQDDVYRNSLIGIQRETAELNILSHIFNRTRKREVKEKIVLRRSHPINIELTEIERDFYQAVLRFIKAEARQKGKSAFVQQWLICTPLRRVSSCLTAMVEHYRNNLGFIDSDVGEDEEFNENDTTHKYLSSDFTDARNRLKEVIGRWKGTGQDSKFEKFMELIHSIREKRKCKIMVFAFFKDTLRYLQKKLHQEGISLIIMTGDTPRNERGALIEKFKTDSTIEVLLSSRVGSEGLDFQFCDTMFNYDLPWNPMEVEQRIGRLDRIGQESAVINIYNFYIENTIEEKILHRLYERIGIFERSIGDLEPIIGGEIKELVSELISNDLSSEEEEERIERSARIIENKRKEIEALEKKATHFIGVDSYFDEEIDRIKRTKRYITSAQLMCFIFDFLKNKCPHTRVEYYGIKLVGKIYPDAQLQRVISDAGKTSELSRFFGSEGIEFTFDSDKAFQNRHFEFFNNAHPLTTVILDYYRKSELKFNNAYHVVLKTGEIRSGMYFYFIFRLKIMAARPSNTLEAVFVDSDSGKMYSGEDAEIILGEMVEKGDNAIHSNFEIEENFLKTTYEQVKSTFMSRLDRLRNEVQKNNDIMVEGRIGSLKMTYNKKIQQKQKQLDKGEMENKDQRWLNMLRAQVKRWGHELQVLIEKEETKKRVSVEYEEVAAGIVEISK